MNNPTEQMMIAAFMANGACDNNYEGLTKTLKHYDGGNVEFMYQMISHSAYCRDVIAAGAALFDEICGVDLYEVAEPFGRWYADATLECEAGGHLPEPEACQAKLRELVREFLLRASNDQPVPAETVERLDQELQSIQP